MQQVTRVRCRSVGGNVSKTVLRCYRSSLAPDLGKATYCDVSSWADSYLDSGVSMAMDTADSTGSDYDSDSSRSSTETVHRSCSCVLSDVEVREGARSWQDRCTAGPPSNPCFVFAADIRGET